MQIDCQIWHQIEINESYRLKEVASNKCRAQSWHQLPALAKNKALLDRRHTINKGEIKYLMDQKGFLWRNVTWNPPWLQEDGGMITLKSTPHRWWIVKLERDFLSNLPPFSLSLCYLSVSCPQREVGIRVEWERFSLNGHGQHCRREERFPRNAL